MRSSVAIFALTSFFPMYAPQQVPAQEVDRAELEWGCIESGKSSGIQFFERHRIAIFPICERGVVFKVAGIKNGLLNSITLERKDEKGRVADRIHAREAALRFDWSRIEFRLTLRDGEFCVDGWIKRCFKDYEVRIPLFSRGK